MSHELSFFQIHTGLQHAIIWPQQPNGLPLNSPTIADKMKEAGYSTHAVGKWHVGFYKKEYLPTSRGFDTYYGMLINKCIKYSHWQLITCCFICLFVFVFGLHKM